MILTSLENRNYCQIKLILFSFNFIQIRFEKNVKKSITIQPLEYIKELLKTLPNLMINKWLINFRNWWKNYMYNFTIYFQYVSLISNHLFLLYWLDIYQKKIITSYVYQMLNQEKNIEWEVLTWLQVIVFCNWTKFANIKFMISTCHVYCF